MIMLSLTELNLSTKMANYLPDLHLATTQKTAKPISRLMRSFSTRRVKRKVLIAAARFSSIK